MKTAEKVVTVLSQAEESQKKAELAIGTANENITLARKDLAQVNSYFLFNYSVFSFNILLENLRRRSQNKVQKLKKP